MPGWMKHKLESRLQGEIPIISDMQMTPSYDRKQRGTKEPLDESEREAEKAGLKLNIKKEKQRSWHWSHHFMAETWGNNGNSDRLFFWAPKSLQKVIAAMKLKDICSLEEKL